MGNRYAAARVSVCRRPRGRLRFSDEELLNHRPVNIGTGEDIAIAEFAAEVAVTVGYSGEIELDPSRPDGTPRKLLDVGRLTRLGWRAKNRCATACGSLTMPS